MTRLQEIADQLGVSTATVSRALNNKPGVNAEIRLKIHQAASQMGYAPNSAARALATASQRTIGFLSLDRDREMPLAYDPFYQHVMRGAEQELARLGYYLVVSTVDLVYLDHPEDLPLIRERRVDGLILPSSFFPASFPRAIQKMNFPLVLVDNLITDPPIDSILAYDEGAGYDATRHLLEHGHTKIAFLGGPCHYASCFYRGAGYRRAMEEAGLPVVMIQQPDTNLLTGAAAMTELLDLAPEVTAIFAANDIMAIGAMRVAQAGGRSVPDDLAAIGVDDIDLAEHNIPSLSTMRIPKRRLGGLAAHRIVQFLNDPNETPLVTLVPTELVARASCGCPYTQSAIPGANQSNQPVIMND
jgi:DNA-binding LacI/PurR family transcriptional regulator